MACQSNTFKVWIRVITRKIGRKSTKRYIAVFKLSENELNKPPKRHLGVRIGTPFTLARLRAVLRAAAIAYFAKKVV